MRLGLRKRRGAARLFVAALCLMSGAFCLHCLLKRAEPSFSARCSDYSNTAFTELVNRCVLSELDKGEFEDFFKTAADSSGRITAIEADTARINRVKSSLSISVQNALNADYPATVYIPLGSLTGYSLLFSAGPRLRVKITPISVVNAAFDETFESAGINRVRHKLSLVLTVDMRYSGRLLNDTERIETSIPIAETVIAGEVPQYYGIEPAVGITP